MKSKWLALPFAGIVAAALAVAGRAQAIDDQTFVREAYAGNLREIAQSRVVLRRTDFDTVNLPRIRAYAQMMIDDHSTAEVSLRAAARAAGIALPSPAPTGDNAKIDRTTGTMAASAAGTSADGDPGRMMRDDPARPITPRRYWELALREHERMLTLLNNEIAGSGSKALKDWADAQVPVVKKHLALAQQYLDGTAPAVNAGSAPSGASGAFGSPGTGQPSVNSPPPMASPTPPGMPGVPPSPSPNATPTPVRSSSP